MIDLHNHILPGVDDGAADMEESVEIGRQFISEGVRRIAATPHLDPERGNGIEASLVRHRVADAQDALRRAGVDLEIVQGQELYLTTDAPDLLRSGRVATLGGGTWVLVEVAMDQPGFYAADTLFQIELAGYRPILAHPERYAFVQRDTASLDALVDRGLVLQLTAPALLGEYGGAIRRTAETLLLRGMYALAGSDRHHPGPARSLAALRDRVSELTDATLADLLLAENPGRVLEDRDVVRPEIRPASRRSLFGRLLGR